MPINSGTLSFSVVAIPVKLHSAIKHHTIRFELLHKKYGSRVRNQFFFPVCKQVVAREDLAGPTVCTGNYKVKDWPPIFYCVVSIKKMRPTAR